jgi:exodeoxyribonuclease VII large subunit
MIEAYPVSSVARRIKGLLESDLTLSNIWVEGEVSNLSRPSSGHTYFTLKDSDGQLRCAMFRRRRPAGKRRARSRALQG